MSGATAMSRGHTQRAAAAAADYYRSCRVPERLEEALNLIYHRGPEDVYGHLSSYFAAFSEPPIISDIRGRKVLDGVGKVTLEAEVVCTVRTIQKRVCAAAVSVDCGGLFTCEAGEDAARLESVETAIRWIRDSIAPSVRGMEPGEQSAIDQLLSDYFRVKKEEEKQRRDDESVLPPTASPPPPTPLPPSSKKKASGKGKKAPAPEKPLPPAEQQEPATRGDLAIAAVSLAVAKSSAVLLDLPLYWHIAALKQQPPPPDLVTPVPLISLLSCAKSSPGKLNLMKEVMVIPKPGTATAQSLDLVSSLQSQILKQMETQSKSGSVIRSVSSLGCLILPCDRLDQPLELIRDACEQLGLGLGTDVYLAINCAAHELMDYSRGRYEVSSGSWKSPDEMVDLYVDLTTSHAAIIALLDPFRREDQAQWEALGKSVGSKCYLLADMASRSAADLLQGSKIPMCSGSVLTLTNGTTVSDLLAAVRLIDGQERLTVLGCSSEECGDDGVVDLAVGLGVRFMKLGGLLRGERTAKYNRLLAIEEDLTHSGTLGRQEEFQFPALGKEPGILQRLEESTEHRKTEDNDVLC
ncbi:enolase 4 isoform 1-T1 [Anomaloglossus baeobatrachus]|uniref:enolase 4 isoform X1 n=1 Tax=Anomaloglossus baeobatrachus TaxID=238106 RepID=UPI003F503938